VVQPVEFIGSNAAGFLINRLTNTDIPVQRVTIKAEFIAGESCRSI
jgi:DNA-binding LacI/PurR family transcriptional regulator